MSYLACIFFLAFYPAIFINAYLTKSKVALSIGSCSVLFGSAFTYAIYNDPEFWTGWIHTWSMSSLVGFGHSGLLFSLLWGAILIPCAIERNRTEKVIEHVDLNTGKVTYKD